MRDHGGARRRGEDPADAFVLDSADQCRDRTNPRHVSHNKGLQWRSSCRNVADWEVLPRRLPLWSNRLEVSREIDY